MNFTYKDDDYKSVYDFGDYLKKSTMLMKDSDKKWEFVCRVDNTQNTLHTTPQNYANQLENIADDFSKFLIERPFDKHFIIEKKSNKL